MTVIFMETTFGLKRCPVNSADRNVNPLGTIIRLLKLCKLKNFIKNIYLICEKENAPISLGVVGKVEHAF